MPEKPTYKQLGQRIKILNDQAVVREQLAEDLERIFNLSPDIIGSGTLEGHFTKINSSFEKLLGYSEEEFLGKPFIQFVHDDDVEKTKEALVDAARGKEIISIENRYKCKDGTYRWIEWKVQVLVAENKFIAVGRDITERKQDEEARLYFFSSMEQIDRVIRQETDVEQMLRNVIYQVFCIFQADRVWLLYPCDPDAKTFRIPIEHTKPEYPGALALNLEMPTTPFIVKDFQEALSIDGPLDYGPDCEMPLVGDNFEQFSVKAQMFMAIYPKIDKPWLFGMHQCAYARKWSAEEKALFKEIGRRISDGLSSLLFFRDLKKSEEKFRQLAENIREVFWIVSPDWQTVYYISPTFTQVWGSSCNDLYRSPQLWIDSIIEEDRDKVIRLIKEAAQADHAEIRFPEYRIKQPSGDLRWIFARGFPIKDEDGKVRRIVGIAEDITDKIHLETELRHAHKMEAIGTLAGGIAHEFNNVLGIIIGNMELALDYVEKWHPVRRNLGEIKKASLRAKEVVRQLLKFSHKVETSRVSIDIALIVGEALKLLRASIPANIKIKEFISRPIDAVVADATQIHQLLINLCNNAAQAMSADGGVLTVELRNVLIDDEKAFKQPDLEPGKYVELGIGDTGHGISSEVLEKIFDPYFTTKEVGKGTGMGLAVVHGIAKTHDGVIHVDSRLGKGTDFRVYFPSSSTVVSPEQKKDERVPGGAEKIIFVDDEISIVEIYTIMLKKLGYDVISETDPVLALEQFKSDPYGYSLVISDMTMPDMTGDRLAQELIKVRPDIPVILCTGFSDKISPEYLKKIGFRGMLMKPVGKADLGNLIREVLDDGD